MKLLSHKPNLSKKIMSNRKEDKLHSQWSLVDLNTGFELVTVRTYWPASKCYACVWTFGDVGYSRGAGNAGGGGYCKQSAAVASALDDAGFTFDEGIAGRGLTAIDDALSAIARHVGLKTRFAIIKAHG